MSRLSWLVVRSGLGGLILRRSVGSRPSVCPADLARYLLVELLSVPVALAPAVLGSRLSVCPADLAWCLLVETLSFAVAFAPVLLGSFCGCALLMWSLNLLIVKGSLIPFSLSQCGHSTLLFVGVGTLSMPPGTCDVWCGCPVEVDGPVHAGGGGALIVVVVWPVVYGTLKVAPVLVLGTGFGSCCSTGVPPVGGEVGWYTGDPVLPRYRIDDVDGVGDGGGETVLLGLPW